MHGQHTPDYLLLGHTCAEQLAWLLLFAASYSLKQVGIMHLRLVLRLQ